MVMFGVDAGPVPNKADLQSFCDILTKRLKRLYDVKGLVRAAFARDPIKEIVSPHSILTACRTQPAFHRAEP
jgi:hypothetical protein